MSASHATPIQSAAENPAPVFRAVNRSLIASSGKVWLYQCLGILLGFAFQSFVSHKCGADALGAITLFLSWLGILSVLTVPGLESLLVYLLPRLEEDWRSCGLVLRQCLVVAGAASVIVAVATEIAGPRLFRWIGLPNQARAAFCVALVMFSIGKILDAAFLGLKDAPAQGYFNNIRTIARFLFCLPVLLYPRASSTVLFYAVTAECALTVVLRFVRLRRSYPGLAGIHDVPRGTNAAPYKALAAVALPMLGISVVDVVYPLLDKALLGIMVPLALVGIYRIGDAVAGINTMFVSPFIAFWPYISQLHGRKRLGDLRDSYKTITLLIIAVMTPFTLLLVELSPFALSFFGPAFVVQGRSIFLVLALGTAIDAIAGPAGAVLKLTGHARLSLTINTAWLLAYLFLSIILVRRYGILGAAIAKMTSTVLGNLANLTANRILLKVFPYSMQHVWLLAAAAAILAARWTLFSACASLGGQFLAGFVQAGLFIAFTAFLLKDQIRRVLLPQLRLWLKKGFVLNAAD